MKSKKLTKSQPTSNQPILVLGWGVDGAGDVDSMAEYFPYDQGLRCVKLPYADSRTVLNEVSAWLKGNTRATILYVGAHGAHNGLTPIGSPRSLDKIGYRELADTLAANLLDKKKPITVWLGACNSEFAADLWQSIKLLPVQLLVTFSGEPHSGLVRDVLKALIEMSNILLPDKEEIPKPLTYLDADVSELKRRFPSLSVHYKARSLTKVDDLPFHGPNSLRAILERPSRLGDDSVLLEAAVAAAQLHSNEDSVNTARQKKPRPRVKVRTVGPRKPTK
jgi:hypothetical protein